MMHVSAYQYVSPEGGFPADYTNNTSPGNLTERSDIGMGPLTGILEEITNKFLGSSRGFLTHV